MSERADTWVTEFGVMPFVHVRRKLKAEPTRPATTADHARRMGERLRAAKAGVVVYARRCAPEIGEYEEPTILASHGEVPDQLLGQ